MLVVVTGLSEGVGLPIELALRKSIHPLLYPLTKLITILALQRAKGAYFQWMQDMRRVRGKADGVNIPSKTKLKISQVKYPSRIRMRGSPLALQ